MEAHHADIEPDEKELEKMKLELFSITRDHQAETMSEATEIIYESCETANAALGPCPKALVGSDGGHWWYVDHAAEEQKSKHGRVRGGDEDFISCLCKTCPQTMRLSIDAEEYPL